MNSDYFSLFDRYIYCIRMLWDNYQAFVIKDDILIPTPNPSSDLHLPLSMALMDLMDFAHT